ncbi:diketogulonate reductase-like aldo/keto reductase [Bradyrhizobium sp. USDA 4486]
MDHLETQGIGMPKLGLGTFRMQGDACRAAVESALAIGYRHIDTAEMYANEEAIGAALAAARLPRGELHVTTKVWHENLSPDAIRRAFDASLSKLRLDHADLYLVHWPSKSANWGAVFETLMKLKEDGRTRAIGVANFTTALLKIAVEDIRAPIACNQIEYHAMLDQSKVLAYLNAKSIPLVAYCPARAGAHRLRSGAGRDRRQAQCDRSPGRAEMAARPERRRRDSKGFAPREPAGQSRRAEDHARRCRPQEDRRAAQGQALRQPGFCAGVGLVPAETSNTQRNGPARGHLHVALRISPSGDDGCA